MNDKVNLYFEILSSYPADCETAPSIITEWNHAYPLPKDIHTPRCFPSHLPVSHPFKVIFLSQSLPSLSFQSVLFFVMHLLAFSLSLTRNQSIISSHSLSYSLPFSFPLALSFSCWLIYYQSTPPPPPRTRRSQPHPSLHSLRLLINQSAYSLASLTRKRLESTLYTCLSYT